MKPLICLLLLFSVYLSDGQEKTVKKPDYVVIANDEIISKEKVNEYAQAGYLKAMKKGVSEEERSKLFEKFGDKIGEKEFIVLVSLFTEEEKQQREKVRGEYIVDTVGTKSDDLPTINVTIHLTHAPICSLRPGAAASNCLVPEMGKRTPF